MYFPNIKPRLSQWQRLYSILPGLKTTRTVQLAHFLLENKGEAQNPGVWSPVNVFQSDDLRCHVICLCWRLLCFTKSKANTAIDVWQYFRALYGDAKFLFQQDTAPARSAKTTTKWFADHLITVLDWPAHTPDSNPTEEDKKNLTLV